MMFFKKLTERVESLELAEKQSKCQHAIRSITTEYVTEYVGARLRIAAKCRYCGKQMDEATYHRPLAVAHGLLLAFIQDGTLPKAPKKNKK